MKKIIAMLLISCMFIAGCGSGMSGGGSGGGFGTSVAPEAEEPAYYTSARMYDQMEMKMYDDDGGDYYEEEQRKVITNASFSVNTDDFETALSSVEQKIASSGSYIQNSNSVAANEYRGAYVSMTIRVPSAKYAEFKQFITELDTLVSSSEGGEDVTIEYYDTEARLKVLRGQAERVESFISEAKDLEDIFTIERELTRINTEIEQLTTVKNRLDNLVSYATVYLEISENHVSYMDPQSFSTKVSATLKNSVESMIFAGQSLLLVIIWCWPLWLLILITFPIWRKYIKRFRKKD